MDEFPFAEDEWARVRESTLSLTNASLANDNVLAQSLFSELEHVLGELRARHGEHPVLIETAADFQDSPTRQVELYRCALELAERNRLPTLSIRLSLAWVLLENFGDAPQAEKELLACQEELSSNADDHDLAAWSKLAPNGFLTCLIAQWDFTEPTALAAGSSKLPAARAVGSTESVKTHSERRITY
jgi:hypothetical protein